MLTNSSVLRKQGISLIETMITLAVVAFALAMGIPGFAAWIQNSQIRNAAESIKTGLQIAQTEALKRNVPMRFQLTSSADNNCSLSTTAANWVVSKSDPSDACATTPETDPPLIVRSGSSHEGNPNAVIAASQSTIIFDSYGKATNVSGTIDFDVSNPTGGACAVDDGPMTCLRIVVSQAGQIRMCNPKLSAGTAQGC